MKIKILLLVCLLLAVPMAEAASKNAAPGSGSNEFCRSFTVQKIVGVIESGEIVLCTSLALQVLPGNEFAMTGSLSTPALGVGATLDVAVIIYPSSDCSITSNVVGQNVVVTGGAIRTEAFTVLAGERAPCMGYYDATVSGAGGVVYRQFIAFNVVVLEPTTFFETTGLLGVEALALFVPLVFLLVAMLIRGPVWVSAPIAVVLLLFGVLFMFFTASVLVLLVGFMSAVAAAGKLTAIIIDPQTGSKPKRKLYGQ